MQKEQQIRNGRSLLKLGKPSTIRLNIMVVGETGSGKTTFLKTLFKLYCGNKIIRAELSTKTMKTVKIEEVGFFTLETPALDCEVHLFDSPGYGDYINNQNAIETVKRHLEQAHDAWLTTNGNPMTEKARNAADGRIHCVFYFIAPHRIKHIDKEFIKQLTGLAPLVLVIAKADTMTWQERKDHLVSVLKLVEELEKVCKMPIAFDFQEEDSGFMENIPAEIDVPSRTPPVAPDGLSLPYNDFLDLSSSFVEETEAPAQDVSAGVGGSEPPHFSFHGQAYVPDSRTSEGFQSTASSGTTSQSSQPADLIQDFAQDQPSTAVPLPLLQPQQPALSSLPLPRIRNAFAVVCDTSESGKREYPWGSLDIYDEQHSDFRRLQRLMFESNHITRLRELTQEMSVALHQPFTGKPGPRVNRAVGGKKVLAAVEPVAQQGFQLAKNTARVASGLFVVLGWGLLMLGLFWCVDQEGFDHFMRSLGVGNGVK